MRNSPIRRNFQLPKIGNREGNTVISIDNSIENSNEEDELETPTDLKAIKSLKSILKAKRKKVEKVNSEKKNIECVVMEEQVDMEYRKVQDDLEESKQQQEYEIGEEWRDQETAPLSSEGEEYVDGVKETGMKLKDMKRVIGKYGAQLPEKDKILFESLSSRLLDTHVHKKFESSKKKKYYSFYESIKHQRNSCQECYEKETPIKNLHFPKNIISKNKIISNSPEESNHNQYINSQLGDKNK